MSKIIDASILFFSEERGEECGIELYRISEDEDKFKLETWTGEEGSPTEPEFIGTQKECRAKLLEMLAIF